MPHKKIILKNCVCSHKERTIMKSEAVSRSLLGIIVLKTIEENKSRIKKGKIRKSIRGREEKGFYTNTIEELRLRITKLI